MLRLTVLALALTLTACTEIPPELICQRADKSDTRAAWHSYPGGPVLYRDHNGIERQIDQSNSDEWVCRDA